MGAPHPSVKLVRNGKFIEFEDIQIDDVVRLAGGLAGGMDQSDPTWYRQVDEPMQQAPPTPPPVVDVLWWARWKLQKLGLDFSRGARRSEHAL